MIEIKANSKKFSFSFNPKCLILLSSTLYLLLLSTNGYCGAWNKEKGHFYSQISYTYLSYNQLLNSNKKRLDLKRTIQDNTLHFYSEYGISKRLNFLLNLPFKMVSSGASLNEVKNDPYINDTLQSGSLQGLSNISLGLRINLLEGKYVLAAQFFYQPNLHQYQPESGLRIGYNASLFCPSILIGRGWQKHYFQAEAGLMLNSSNYAQNAIGSFEIGKKLFHEKSLLIFRTDIKLPMNVGQFNEGNSVQTGLFRDNSSFISPGFKWIQHLTTHLYLNLAIYGAVYSHNEGANATYNFGLAYDW